jgi:hypothetical protein
MSSSALLESTPDVYPESSGHQHTTTVIAAILDHLDEQMVISLDSLICLMPQYTWNQIFHTVDHLARCNKIVLRRHGYDYTLFSNHFLA